MARQSTRIQGRTSSSGARPISGVGSTSISQRNRRMPRVSRATNGNDDQGLNQGALATMVANAVNQQNQAMQQQMQQMQQQMQQMQQAIQQAVQQVVQPVVQPTGHETQNNQSGGEVIGNQTVLIDEELEDEDVLPPPPPAVGQLAPSQVMLDRFLKHKPGTFQGGVDSSEVVDWIEQLEVIFEVLECNEYQKSKYAAYCLKGEAKRWWKLLKDSRPPYYIEYL